MAICTNYVALCHFSSETLRRTTADKVRNICNLVALMIKLKNNNVVFTTINTGMFN